MRVLVADDDPGIRRMTSSTLTRLGFEIMVADDVDPALAMIEIDRPDLALVDLNMSSSGLDVVRRLKELYGAQVWVAVFSGDEGDDIRSECMAAGADDVLTKPSPNAELRRRILAAARTQQTYLATMATKVAI